MIADEPTPGLDLKVAKRAIKARTDRISQPFPIRCLLGRAKKRLEFFLVNFFLFN